MTKDGIQLPTPPELPDDLSACHAMIGQLLENLGSATRKISQMEHQLGQLLRRLYGRSSEKIDPAQMALFAELLGQEPPQDPPAEPAPVAPTPSRNGHGRRRLPADLPRERVIHDLDEDEKPCPCCGQMRTCIGEETSEQLDYVPAQVKVIEHVRLKYVCRPCEQAAAEGGPRIATATRPLWPIEKGLAAPGLLAYVIVSKYDDHLPLHRLEKILARHDIRIARSTLCDWMRQAADVLRPLTERMSQRVRAGKVIHTDDTPVDVLEPKGRGAKTGRFWVYVGDEDHPQTVFDYTPSRSRDGPMNFLQGWGKDQKRYLQADAFGGYDGIYAGRAGGQVVEVACWAHARRKFYDARHSDHRHSAQALATIRLLYDTEAQARELFAAQASNAADGQAAPAQPMAGQDGAWRSLAEIRLELRQRDSVQRLEAFKDWLEALRAERGGPVLPKSPMGQAITYALNQWDALCVYTTDGDLAIDNNVSENALRRIAIGRKNWLFAGSDTGGATAAVLFSLIATCQRHAVEPLAYLRDVLTRIAAHPISRLDELLPNHWQPQA